MEISRTSKGMPLLVLDGQAYYLNKEKDGKRYWECSKRYAANCKSRGVTSGDRILSDFSAHNHAADPATVKVSLVHT